LRRRVVDRTRSRRVQRAKNGRRLIFSTIQKPGPVGALLAVGLATLLGIAFAVDEERYTLDDAERQRLGGT
jgi:hypothetical protein